MPKAEHIRWVRNVRGSRLPRGRALPREEIRVLFRVCDEDKKLLGLRDAAIFGVMFGGGLRRSEVFGLDLASLVSEEHALRVLGKVYQRTEIA